jgi:hypothetical protein
MGQVNDQYEVAPIRSRTGWFPPVWIYYNGNMNVAYYTMAFDLDVD